MARLSVFVGSTEAVRKQKVDGVFLALLIWTFTGRITTPIGEWGKMSLVRSGEQAKLSTRFSTEGAGCGMGVARAFNTLWKCGKFVYFVIPVKDS
jgi:hypothetical protein